MTAALAIQVGGSHYKTQAIQAIEFAERNGYGPSQFSILRYLSRHENKNGKQDLEKALHYIELHREVVGGFVRPNRTNEVTMAKYIRENGYSGLRAQCLAALGDYVHKGTELAGEYLAAKIRDLIAQDYPE